MKFPDDTQVAVIGMDDIMAEFYAEGREATNETAEEIIERLEAKKNFIPSSKNARRKYAFALLKEYLNYMKDRSGSGR